jgi:hypothetical protein
VHDDTDDITALSTSPALTAIVHPVSVVLVAPGDVEVGGAAATMLDVGGMDANGALRMSNVIDPAS